MANHMPLRVYVDHCVATTTPDAEATLRYDFIDNYGWAQSKPKTTILQPSNEDGAVSF